MVFFCEMFPKILVCFDPQGHRTEPCEDNRAEKIRSKHEPNWMGISRSSVLKNSSAYPSCWLLHVSVG